MQAELKSELIAVFDQLGVSEEERTDLKTYYLSRLVQAQSDRDGIQAAIVSLQSQLEEVDERIGLLQTAVEKVAVILPDPEEGD